MHAIEIHEVVPIVPEHIPAGSTYKGYQDYLVQDLIISAFTCIENKREIAPLPDVMIKANS